jgi:hypothetical protein
MTPIFNKETTQLTAWVDDDGYIFSTNFEWIAFVEKDYVFSNNCRWLGGLYKGTIIDKDGRPVAWLENTIPQSTTSLLAPPIPLTPLSPLAPLNPLMPLKPLVPLTPLGGWSELNWKNFILQ